MSEGLARLEPIQWLGERALPAPDLDELTVIENSARRLHETLGITPTIGCEVK